MFVLLIVGMIGCAARGTYDFLSIEQQYQSRVAQRTPYEAPDPSSRETRDLVKSGQPLNLPKGLYEWTMAEQFMKKAWEEYSNAEYEQASKFAKIALDWTELAKQAEAASMEAEN